MNEYNFLNLSSFEFENLSRDILQAKTGVFFESFTSGQDGGIDLRATVKKEENIIVQAKRYTRFSDLKSTLRNEFDNVSALNPDRYILTTSVGLTPKNKDEILKIFHPYIKCTEDIIGKDDLNNLLGLYPNIEEKYYKLWLASATILDRLVHSTVYNQSRFELEEIKETLKVYVQNDSFKEAIEILKANKYVIVSGIPGIGKTTLSRMLVYTLLAEDFDEFVYVSGSINDAYSYYKDDQKQVFFFDDFLGKNFLETGLAVNEDNKIIKFIERVKRSKNKVFILATREYILAQAKNSFELLNNPSLDLVKCTLDLSKYTRLIRAEILYNHLFFANVPIEYLRNLIDTKSYVVLIGHKNYNPRIIETFVKNQFWDDCEPSDFSKTLISFFDNPTSVWEHAFENTISKGSQIVLLVLSTMGTPVLLEDLRVALNSFITANSHKYGLTIDPIQFRKIIKELESTFIATTMDSYGKIAVDFQNPSIQDFLINYMDGKKALIIDLIKSFCFVSQFFRVFTFEEQTSEHKRRITLDKDIVDEYVQKITYDYDIFRSSSIYRSNYSVSNKFKWERKEGFVYGFLNQILIELKNASNKELEEFVVQKFEENILPIFDGYNERKSYIELLSKMDKDLIAPYSGQIISNFAEYADSIEKLKDFSRLQRIFNEEYDEFVLEDEFTDKIAEVVHWEIEATDASGYEGLIEELKDIEFYFDYYLETEIENIEVAHRKYKARTEDDVDFDEYRFDALEAQHELEKEDEMISNLFEGLTD
ncbi:restriction endonuclease [Flagellimonas sp.]|uniref:nSTAND3 domain-containing NTPase n=1 Tax=Flagellimonas sp. TaxID=2058762 RepID=UPI003BAA144F